MKTPLFAVTLLGTLALAACGQSDRGGYVTGGAEPPKTVPPADPDAGTGGGAWGTRPVLFGGKVDRAEHAAPVVGGTLLVTRDGQTIVAADPDRDAVFVVGAQSHALSTVTLERSDEPGRVAEGPRGTVYVALRRAGALVAIDLESATITQRVPVCSSPRGVAYDAKHGSVHVACRSGQLVTLSAKDLAIERSIRLDSDLRDVIVREQDLIVTRFLDSELLVVSNEGEIMRRARPTPPDCGAATAAFRALDLQDGRVLLAHQASSDRLLAGSSASYYHVGCGGALVRRELTLVDPDKPTEPLADLPGSGLSDPAGERALSAMTFDVHGVPSAGPLDLAFTAKGSRVAAIALDDSLGSGATSSTANLWITAWGGTAFPDLAELERTQKLSGITVKGQPIAVAFDAQGDYVVQSREPATLELEDGTSISLSAESHADSGQLMFYMNSSIGLSCSSCHPEGGEDGHVWHFAQGLRRTMPLEGGVMERAPFHWDGSLGDMNALVNEVMITRMGLPADPSQRQIDALSSFLEQLAEPAADDALDVAAVARGAKLFKREDVACATCHSGAQYTDNRLADVGTGGVFATPSLLGVGLRGGLFHDGCAKNIEQRFGACGGTAHGKPELLSAAERADLITFLRSL